LEEEKLVLEIVEDKCFLNLRAESLTNLPWIPHNPQTDVMAADSSSPTPTAIDTRIRPADGMVMVYVPAGKFEMGSDDKEVDYALQLCNKYYDDCEQKWFEA
jgi:formylglycine-generating enzyme required for sulfatase activity